MNIFIFTAVVIACSIAVLYLWAMISKHHASIDVGHGLMAIAAALAAYLYQSNPTMRSELVTLLVCAWGMRLFIHLYFIHRQRGEHHRLSSQRELWKTKGKTYEVFRSFVQVFVVQGIFMYIVLLPVILVNTGETQAMQWYNWVGALLWVIGFIIQTNTDNTLYSHTSYSNNKNILTHGLWKYTRHPNYFAEVLIWFGIALVCLFGTAHSLLAFASPLFVIVYILYVTIPATEKSLTHKPGWEGYIRKTSPLFPWPPKK
jgi:steroid 5-alpha reductase family enzyme